MRYDITEFINGKTGLVSGYIQAAIDQAAQNGGGTVVVPAGEYLCGSIELKSNITLFLESGARLTASTNLEDYKEVGYHHNELGNVKSFLYGMNVENVSIEGNGEIDLSGDAFFDFSRPRIPEAMKDIITEEQKQECTVDFDERLNQPVFFFNSRKVTFRNITITNSPCWTITFAECMDIKVLDLTIINSMILPNNDGLHFCGCNGVIVKGCNITSADDCIAVSGITNWEKPCENITISDCILKSCSKALVLGYMHSIVRNVTVSNVVITDSNRGLCIMASTGTGLVENITYHNCVVDTRVRAGDWWGNGEPICVMARMHNSVPYEGCRNWTEAVRNIIFSGIICHGENLVGIVGENQNIRGIDLIDVKLKLKESKNRYLKGCVVDLSPALQVPTIPQDGEEYTLLVMEATDVTIRHFTGSGVAGNEGKRGIIHSEVRWE